MGLGASSRMIREGLDTSWNVPLLSPPAGGTFKSTYVHKRSRCLFGQVKGVRRMREEPNESMTIMWVQGAPENLNLLHLSPRKASSLDLEAW